MTDERINSAIDQCESVIIRHGIRFLLTSAHLLSMIERMRPMVSNPNKREKVMRWLGFIQGALWVMGFAHLDDLKKMNMDPSKLHEFNPDRDK